MVLRAADVLMCLDMPHAISNTILRYINLLCDSCQQSPPSKLVLMLSSLIRQYGIVTQASVL